MFHKVRELSKDLAIYGVVALVGILVAAGVWRWRTRVNDQTGDPHHRVLWAFGVLAIFLAVGYFALAEPFRFTWPTLGENRRRLIDGFAINAGFKRRPKTAVASMAPAMWNFGSLVICVIHKRLIFKQIQPLPGTRDDCQGREKSVETGAPC